jgi:hypothetical protein
MKHASSRMLFAYWDALRGERAAPERGEIEPGEIRHVLADALMLEIGASGNTQIRLAGTRLCALFGRELKGEAFHALWPAHAGHEVDNLIETVTEETAGVVVGLVGTTPDENIIGLELILLPLRFQGKTHIRILGALSPALIPPWIGFDHIERLTTVSLRIIRASGRDAVAPAASPEVVMEKSRRFVVHHGGRI